MKDDYLMKKHFQVVTVLYLILVSYSTNLQAQDRVIELSTVRNANNIVDFFYKKNKPGSYTIKVELTSLSNSNNSTYIEEVVENSSGKLFTLRPANPAIGIGYGYKFIYVMGNSRVKVDSLFQYILPFSKGKKVTVYESSNLNEKYFGAEKIESWKSYSTSSKTIDSVFAMRKGIVVNIKNEFENDTITNVVYTSKTNTIQIEHEDGTYALYKGFKKNSFKVNLGDVVYPNTMLGTLNKFNNQNYTLHFTIFYLNKDLSFTTTNQTLKTAKNSYLYLKPYFHTQEGLIQIVPRNTYTADYSEAILTKEMSKREIKQRLKNKI